MRDADDRQDLEDYQYGVENVELDQFLKQVSNQIFKVSSPSDIKAMLALQEWCTDGAAAVSAAGSDGKQALHDFISSTPCLDKFRPGLRVLKQGET
ncbi:MAG: hypothetical protein ACLSFJ_00770 [Holdemania filiformis]